LEQWLRKTQLAINHRLIPNDSGVHWLV
jgi:hypothetical protein